MWGGRCHTLHGCRRAGRAGAVSHSTRSGRVVGFATLPCGCFRPSSAASLVTHCLLFRDKGLSASLFARPAPAGPPARWGRRRRRGAPTSRLCLPVARGSQARRSRPGTTRSSPSMYAQAALPPPKPASHHRRVVAGADSGVALSLVPHEHSLFRERNDRVCTSVGKLQEHEKLRVKSRAAAAQGLANRGVWTRSAPGVLAHLCGKRRGLSRGHGRLVCRRRSREERESGLETTARRAVAVGWAAEHCTRPRAV